MSKRVRILTEHGSHKNGHNGLPLHPIIRRANRELVLGMEGWSRHGGWYYVASMRFMRGWWHR